MKKNKNMKLMLLGLLAMGSMNAWAQVGTLKKMDNLVYKVTDVEKKEVTFEGLSAAATTDGINTTETINVPATIAPKDAEGNPESYTVVGITNDWFKTRNVDSETGDDTQAVGGTLKTFTTAKKVKLTADNLNNIFTTTTDGLTVLETLKLGDVRNCATIPSMSATFYNTIKVLDLGGVTNDVDGDVTFTKNGLAGCKELTTVTLPEKSPVILPMSTFLNDAKLVTVNNFSQVKSIGESAFKGTGLKGAFTIPATVEELGKGAFEGTKITEITINAKVASIPADLFKSAPLTKVTVASDDIVSIAAGAFSATPSALTDVTLSGAKLKTITAGAFGTKNQSLKNVDLSGTIITDLYDFNSTVDDRATAVLEKYLFPSTVTTLVSFEGYKKLAQISDIPAGVSALPNNAFSGCVSLETINLTGATGLEKLGAKSFYHCAKLKAIDLSNTLVCEIPASAFEMNVDNTKGDEGPDGTKRTFETALTLVKLRDMTTNPTDAKGKEVKVTKFIINASAFKNCNKLESIEGLNQAKLSLNGTAIFAYSGLKNVDLTNAVGKDGDAYILSTIPTSTFYMNTALESVTLPEGINSIGDYAFRYNTKQKSIVLNKAENLESIGKSAFQFSGLTELNLTAATNKNFTKILGYTFAKCESLKTVKLPIQIAEIEKGAFADDILLESINLNETSITKLNNIFTTYTASPDKEISLDKLTSLELVKSTELKDKDGKKIVLPEITEIADYALQFTGLKEIVIPESVKKMGTGAFRACTNLEKFTWKNVFEDVHTLPANCFQGDVKLAEVYFLTTGNATEAIKDKEVFFMCDKDLLKVYLTPDQYNFTVAAGYGNENRQYSTLDVEGNKQFAFSEKGQASDGYYYATYYNLVNSSWFKTSEFDVFAAVVEGNKVVLKKATADGDYYKVAALSPGKNDAAAVCVVRSKNIDAVPELNSNAGSASLTTLDKANGLNYVAKDGDAKGSKLNYIFKLANKGGKVAFYRVTSGEFKAKQVYIEATTSSARLNIVVEGEGEITGIQDIFSEEAAQADAPVYNLQGARMNGTLQKGIYVKNGKKFIVK